MLAASRTTPWCLNTASPVVTLLFNTIGETGPVPVVAETETVDRGRRERALVTERREPGMVGVVPRRTEATKLVQSSDTPIAKSGDTVDAN